MRRFLYELSLLAAVTAGGGYALAGIASPSIDPPPLALDPVVVDHAMEPLDDALRVLRTTPTFASASVGYGGVVPDALVAWRTVLSHPAASELFVDLLHRGTAEGRAYALAGLRAIDPRLFLHRARSLRGSAEPVKTMVGCILGMTTMAQVVAELDRGLWIEEFVTASRLRYHGTLPWPDE